MWVRPQRVRLQNFLVTLHGRDKAKNERTVLQVGYDITRIDGIGPSFGTFINKKEFKEAG